MIKYYIICFVPSQIYVDLDDSSQVCLSVNEVYELLQDCQLSSSGMLIRPTIT